LVSDDSVTDKDIKMGSINGKLEEEIGNGQLAMGSWQLAVCSLQLAVGNGQSYQKL
jgi:hypothetical protein